MRKDGTPQTQTRPFIKRMSNAMSVGVAWNTAIYEIGDSMTQTTAIKKMAVILQDGKVTDEEAKEALQIVKAESDKFKNRKIEEHEKSLFADGRDQFVRGVNQELTRLKSTTRLASLLFSKEKAARRGDELKMPDIFKDAESDGSDDVSFTLEINMGCSLKFYFNADGSLVAVLTPKTGEVETSKKII